MSKRESIEKEISGLNKIKSYWGLTMKAKPNVNDLISAIEFFNQTFSEQFPNAAKHYKKNCAAEIRITDGIDKLKKYVKSTLKVKEDEHFTEGIFNITFGIQKIIGYLVEDLDEIKKA